MAWPAIIAAVGSAVAPKLIDYGGRVLKRNLSKPGGGKKLLTGAGKSALGGILGIAGGVVAEKVINRGSGASVPQPALPQPGQQVPGLAYGAPGAVSTPAAPVPAATGGGQAAGMLGAFQAIQATALDPSYARVYYRAPKGYVMVTWEGQKYIIPRRVAMSYKLWKPAAKPPIKASDYRCLRKAKSTVTKLKRIEKMSKEIARYAR